MDDRRIGDTPCWDASLVMGIGYTTIYAGIIGGLLLVDIPTENVDTVKILAGAMTLIQSQIVGFFFGSSKSAEVGQRVIAASNERTGSTLRNIVAGAPTKVDDVNVEAAGDVNISKAKKK